MSAGTWDLGFVLLRVHLGISLLHVLEHVIPFAYYIDSSALTHP